MRREILDVAKRAYAKTGPCACELNKLCDLCATNITIAVLKAALTGEPVGEWFIAGAASDPDLPTATHSSGFAVCRDLGRGLTEVAADGLSREHADLFANALNLLADLGGTDGE